MTEPDILHTAHPGSRIAAAASAAGQEAPPVPAVPHIPWAPPVEAVPVRVKAAEEGTGRTMVLQPAQARQLLPQDPERARALLIAVDNPVVLCATKELAQAADNQITNVPYPTGFYLPVGVPVAWQNKGLWWAVNTSSSAASRVSVLVEHENPGI
jgi:hypothetical protein